MSMRIHRSIPPFLMALCLLACSQLAGCGDQSGTGGQDTAVPLSSGSQTAGILPSRSEAGPPLIVLRNPSPGQLEVNVIVKMGGYDRTTRETTTVSISFSSKDRIVQFAGDERLTCNSKTILLHNQVGSLQIVEAPTGTLGRQPFSCTYSAGGVSATLTLTIPYAPVIRSPQDLAQLPRSTHTLITYDAQGGKLLGIVALGPQSKAIAQVDTPHPLQATVDTSTFPPGPGSLALTQTLAPQITQSGTPFKSLSARGDAVALIDVTWV